MKKLHFHYSAGFYSTPVTENLAREAVMKSAKEQGIEFRFTNRLVAETEIQTPVELRKIYGNDEATKRYREQEKKIETVFNKNRWFVAGDPRAQSM